jgi:hypothetical protein
MDNRSQQSNQAMEPQTRFNLNDAIRNWQQALAAQPGLAPECCLELESHLRDSIAKLQQRGLNEEESFWLARRRVGSPQKLSEEFDKANPARAWRERLFWMALALLIIRFWTEAWSTLIQVIGNFNRFLPEWVVFYMPLWFQHLAREVPGVGVFLALVFYLPLILFVVAVARGHVSSHGFAALRCLLQHRLWFFVLTAMLLLGMEALWLAVTGVLAPGIQRFVWQQYCLRAVTSLGLVGVLVWFLPAESEHALSRG